MQVGGGADRYQDVDVASEAMAASIEGRSLISINDSSISKDSKRCSSSLKAMQHWGGVNRQCRLLSA